MGDIGQVSFVRRKRTRKLSLSLESAKTLRVTVPYWLSFKEAKKIILSNTEWVNRYIARMRSWKEEHEILPINPEDIDPAEAAEKLRKRTKDLAERHGLEFSKVTIRSQKTRWGSCSAGNNISLNVKLNRLPDRLIDYVILHELIHTRIKSHKKAFWAELEKFIRLPKDKDGELRKYNIAFLEG